MARKDDTFGWSNSNRTIQAQRERLRGEVPDLPEGPVVFTRTVVEVAPSPYNPAGICVTTTLQGTAPGRETFLADFASDGDGMKPVARSAHWMAEVARQIGVDRYTVETTVERLDGRTVARSTNVSPA